MNSYHFAGLILEFTKKQAVVGAPISLIFATCLVKKSFGGSRGMDGWPSGTVNPMSGLAFLIVAAKLLKE